ncbi:tetratricopeptide repeat-containing diguanylate cyclase [Shewanella waksmanii]|uniref:tetratricopeptide repeat-containing diguanylate cyclase n=1 Tax=Shewanella waksmanii TaxID=213783 RepID=UPI0004ADD880|nr:tetratricopeptide repeat-containing diguanylate cyclase [Shewanella waksmanii]
MSINIARLLLVANLLLIGFVAPERVYATETIDRILEQADQARSSDPVNFNDSLEKLSKHEHEMDNDQRAYFQYLQAYSLSFKGQFARAVEIYTSILNADVNSDLKFRANLSIVNSHAISKNWSQGLSHLSYLVQHLNSVKSRDVHELGLVVASIFYNQIGQYELGFNYANRLADLVSSGRNHCIAHNLKLESQFELGQLAENDPRITAGLAACQDVNEVVMESAIYSYLAELYLDNQQPQQALAVLEAQLPAIEQTQYAPALGRYYSLLARAYLQSSQAESAEQFAFKTLEHSKNLGNSRPITFANHILFQIAESRGEHQLALDYHKKYAAADKAFLDDVKTKHLAFQLAQHQATEQRNQIDLLDKQNNLLRVEQKLATTEAENNRLFISLLISIITLLGFWAYKSWKTQQRLKQLAEYDALTKVYNRGHFTHLAEDALKYCGSANIQLSCILFDLDKFKQINDNYGHGCGDWVLKQVAKVCQAQGRKNDIFARLGGEEFCMILPSCDLHTALKLAESCRVAINQIDTAPSGHDFTISASLGVTDTQLSGYSLEQLTTDADSAMYQSKDDGRNRISVYSPKGEQLSLDALSSARL